MIRSFSCLRSSVSFACLILGLAAVMPPAVHGQFLQGTIDGNVTDTSQAALVGAKIVAIEQATGLVRETVTNAAGVYTLPNVPPGTYTVTISSLFSGDSIVIRWLEKEPQPSIEFIMRVVSIELRVSERSYVLH